MAAKEHAVRLDRGYSTRGIDRRVSLYQNHARHVTRHQMTVLWAGSRGAPLRGHEAVALNLARELLERGRLKAGEDQRRLDRLQRRAGGKHRAHRC